MQTEKCSTSRLSGLIFALTLIVWFRPEREIRSVLAQSVPTVTPVFTPLPTTVPSLCWPTDLPIGAIAGQPGPVFCNIVNGGPDTSAPNENGWQDEFEHTLTFANFDNTTYRLFETLGVHQSLHWRHANHWMVDLAPDSQAQAQANNAVGGAMLRPDRTFRFQAGTLRVDTEYAAGLPVYGANAWGEIIITTGDHPVYNGNPNGEVARRDLLYGYDMFPNHWTLGCRFQADSHTTCALMENNAQGPTDGGRAWEISFFQIVGETSVGGVSDGSSYRFCQAGDPDMECRDRFRLELTSTSLTIYANGTLYFAQTGLPPLPDELVTGNLYIYLASIVNLAQADTVRFHWDHFAVNSADAPSPAPGFDAPSLVQVYLPLVFEIPVR